MIRPITGPHSSVMDRRGIGKEGSLEGTTGFPDFLSLFCIALTIRFRSSILSVIWIPASLMWIPRKGAFGSLPMNGVGMRNGLGHWEAKTCTSIKPSVASCKV